jgi:hypothetical protein
MHSTQRLALLCLTLTLAAVGCQEEATGSAQLAVSVGQALSSAASVSRVTVTSSGPGIPSVTTELARTGTMWTGVIGNLPAGSQRVFLARAFDAGNTLLFEGSSQGVTITANQTTLVALTLQEVNPPPPFSNEGPIIQSVSATPTTVQAGGTLSVESEAVDPNVGDTLSYAWTASAGTFLNPTHPSTSWIAPATTGVVTLTLTVNDARGASSSISLAVNVVTGSGEGSALLDVRFNSWPRVSALSASASLLDAGQSTTVAATASDGDGDSLSFQWAASCAGSWTNATSPTASFVPSELPAEDCNNCQLTVTVSDGRGGRTTGSVALCVASNPPSLFPPTFTRSYQSALTAQPAQQLTFEVTASDPQNSALSFSWSASAGTAGAAQSSANTSRVSWTAPACVPATTPASITATATNAHGMPATRSFTVTGLPPCSGWSPAGTMATGRYYSTSTLLPNGKVLVAGGTASSSGPIMTADLYSPDTNTWSPASPMPATRSIHTATLLPTGKVLLVGGGPVGGGTWATAVLYDPATDTWSSTGSMASARHSHTMSPLPSGKVLVMGGRNETVVHATAELYDPATGSWSSTGSMASPRQQYAAAPLLNGKVLVVGGMNDAGFLATAELYDPATGSWAPAGSMSRVRISPMATLLPNGKVLVTGGSGTQYHATAELYDPATNSWALTGSMASPRYGHTATLLADGKVLVAGGFSGNLRFQATAELYDPATGSWSPAGSMAAARHLATATLLSNGRVLIAGGHGGSSLAAAEIYTPQ